MIEALKMINGTDKVNPRKLFCIDQNRRTRKHSLSLKIRKHINTNIRLNFFTRRGGCEVAVNENKLDCVSEFKYLGCVGYRRCRMLAEGGAWDTSCRCYQNYWEC